MYAFLDYSTVPCRSTWRWGRWGTDPLGLSDQQVDRQRHFQKHAETYQAKKQDGVTTQRVVIHYNYIDAFDVPDHRKIPEADIIMETRKGAALSYAPHRLPYKLGNKKCGVSSTDPLMTLRMCQDVSDDKKSPWCIAIYTIYTIISYLLVSTRFLQCYPPSYTSTR